MAGGSTEVLDKGKGAVGKGTMGTLTAGPYMDRFGTGRMLAMAIRKNILHRYYSYLTPHPYYKLKDTNEKQNKHYQAEHVQPHGIGVVVFSFHASPKTGCAHEKSRSTRMRVS